MTLALVEPKLMERGVDAGDGLLEELVTPRRPDLTAPGPVHDRVHPRHAQHAGLRWHWPSRSTMGLGGSSPAARTFKINHTPIDGGSL